MLGVQFEVFIKEREVRQAHKQQERITFGCELGRDRDSMGPMDRSRLLARQVLTLDLVLHSDFYSAPWINFTGIFPFRHLPGHYLLRRDVAELWHQDKGLSERGGGLLRRSRKLTHPYSPKLTHPTG